MNEQEAYTALLVERDAAIAELQQWESFHEANILDAMQEVAKVLAHGREKYPANDWEKQSYFKHMIHALQHVNSSHGSRLEEESGCMHMAHAACRLLMATAVMMRESENG